MNKVLLLSGVIIISLVYILTQFQKLQIPAQVNNPPISTVQPISTIKTYSSKTLRLTIQVPSSYTLDEKFTTITLTSSRGKILVDRNGTNFSNVQSYLTDLSQKNHFILLNESTLTINNQSAISGLINHLDGTKEKIYFIYSDYAIYNFSTSSPDLYSDLDQIAQSFKYTP
ncbi:hypothetical protein HY025_00545 [Candidatus Daviesbacteria bacterium]|nr:hypothetical protein [Candidatus Daviesbacteria bacterium]